MKPLLYPSRFIIFAFFYYFILILPSFSNEDIEIDDVIRFFRAQEKVLKWLEKDVFENSFPLSKCKSNSLFAMEVLSGVGRGIVFFKLGYNLGERMFDMTEPGKAILASIYGTSIFVPAAVMGTNLSSNIFRKMVRKKTQTEKEIELNPDQFSTLKEYVAKLPVITASLISAPPITYLTYDELYKVLNWGWIVPGISTFYVSSIMGYYSIMTISKMVYNTLQLPLDRHFAISHPGTREDFMIRIYDHLTQARSFIDSLNSVQSERFSNLINQETNIAQKFHVLSHPNLFIEGSVRIKKDSWLKKMTEVMGGLIGGYGTLVYYPVAKSSISAVLSLFIENYKEEEYDNLVTGLSIISITSASSITALATWSSTCKFYNATLGLCSTAYKRIRSWCKPSSYDEEQRLLATQNTADSERDKEFIWKRLGAASISAMLASFNARMQANIALEFRGTNLVSSRLNLAAICIACFSLNFWGMDEALFKYLKASDPRTPLLGKIDKIIEKLPSMSDDSLKGLKNLLEAFESIR